MENVFDRKIILENGTEFYGSSFGAEKDAVLELVFNTSMVGYQEILSDPSYAGQAVVMTYPLIGNYGTAADDYESSRPAMGAMIVRQYENEPSNFRSVETLSAVMRNAGVIGISGVDTRKLTRMIRDRGTGKVLIADAALPLSDGIERLRATDLRRDLVPSVSCREETVWGPENKGPHIVILDCGIKQNIIRSFLKRDCRVTTVPWNTGADRIRSLDPDGIFVSNGPGDPSDVPETVRTVRSLLGSYPLFGICLGHQILSLAYGAKTYKLKFGHRGGNHPVRNLETGRIEITSQNHSYAVLTDSLSRTPLTVTHLNLLDETVEGVRCGRDSAFGVQYHPESSPGPQDSSYLFDRFLDLIGKGKNHAEKN
ncbi:MAG: glutamine-hydrolyzing carbamoyl-phosphate synthase small subunit [Clostridia bacterium]|nr:glutamine-hydrolyzing carbamoyl-phosphate synthase small subunit [Clostridia bacterium]